MHIEEEDFQVLSLLFTIPDNDVLDPRHLERINIRYLNNLFSGNARIDLINSIEVKLTAAIHLSSLSALNREETDPTPRREYIRRHLIQHFGAGALISERLSPLIGQILDDFFEARASTLSNYRSFLLKRQNGKCACCKHDLNNPDVVEDDFKPYYQHRALLTPHVDHINPVSLTGSNLLENLQVLCALCNQGKGNWINKTIFSELEYAGYQRKLAKVPISVRSSVFFSVVWSGRSRCAMCHSPSNELTIRPKILDGPYARSNLYSVCYWCISAHESA